MAKYIVFFSFTPDALSRMIQSPGDRKAPVAKMIEGMGGKLESYYWMFGDYDGFVIAQLPDSAAAAAVSLAVSSTGAFQRLETHELIEADHVMNVLQAASKARGSYTAPGTKIS